MSDSIHLVVLLCISTVRYPETSFDSNYSGAYPFQDEVAFPRLLAFGSFWCFRGCVGFVIDTLPQK